MRCARPLLGLAACRPPWGPSGRGEEEPLARELLPPDGAAALLLSLLQRSAQCSVGPIPQMRGAAPGGARAPPRAQSLLLCGPACMRAHGQPPAACCSRGRRVSYDDGAHSWDRDANNGAALVACSPRCCCSPSSTLRAAAGAAGAFPRHAAAAPAVPPIYRMPMRMTPAKLAISCPCQRPALRGSCGVRRPRRAAGRATPTPAV